MNELLHVTQTACDEHNIEELFSAAIRAVKQRLEAQTIALVLLNPESIRLEIKISRGLSEQFINRFPRPVAAGTISEVVMEGKCIYVEDCSKMECDPLKMENPAGCLMCIPLRAGGNPLGYLYVDHGNPSHFSLEQKDEICMISNVLALALDRQHYMEEYRRFHCRDEETGLMAPRYFWSRLSEELQRARRDREDLSLLIISVDNLKQCTTVYGHQAAHSNFCRFIKELLDCVRVYDNAGRFGPEEIAIYLPHADIDQAEIVARRIVDGVNTIYAPGGKLAGMFPLVISIGIGTMGDKTDITSFLEEVQVALHTAQKTIDNSISKT